MFRDAPPPPKKKKKKKTGRCGNFSQVEDFFGGGASLSGLVMGTVIYEVINGVGNRVSSAAQKIKKLSETPATIPIVAKLCMIDCKNRKNAKKLVQPVTPHLGCF